MKQSPSTAIKANGTHRIRAMLLYLLMLGPALLNFTGLYNDITLAGLSATALLFLIANARVRTSERAAFSQYALWVFVFGALLHLAYELVHSIYFTHFMMPGYTYPELVEMLIVAAYADGLLSLILLASSAMLFPQHWRWGKLWHGKHSLIVVFMAALLQIGIEMVALRMGDWGYTEAMPMIPILNVGLTPVLQLPLLILPTFWLASKHVQPCLEAGSGDDWINAPNGL